MSDLSQQLEKEIVKKNTILNSCSEEYYSNKEQVHEVELELDELLYQYYKLLRYKID